MLFANGRGFLQMINVRSSLIADCADGGISKTREIKEAIRRSANYPVFWKFVGLGGSNYGILERMDTFSDRCVDNSNFLRSIILPT